MCNLHVIHKLFVKSSFLCKKQNILEGPMAKKGKNISRINNSRQFSIDTDYTDAEPIQLQ